MKKAYQIYIKIGVNPEKYGFVKTDDGWFFKDEGCRSGLFIEPSTGRMSPYLGYTSRTVSKVIEMAEDKVFEVDKNDYQPYIMRLSYEEMVAINKMRGHPPEDGE